jgi:tetratricopeptide (TPR) repeat protein
MTRLGCLFALSVALGAAPAGAKTPPGASPTAGANKTPPGAPPAGSKAAPGAAPAGAKPPPAVQAAQGGRKTARKPLPPKGPKGVRQLFDEAQKLYDAGRYVEALRAFDGIVRKYPGHEPAQLQLAKTLYRLDKLKEAYQIFARINPQHLDPETSYEYGWSFYQNKQWQGALYGFQRVPKGHALFDLANYYGGICAIKVRKYDEAADMLEKAVVLPDKLAKSRALYIKHLQALTLLQQKSSLSKEREAELQRLTEPKKSKRDKAKEKAAAEAGPYQHKGKKSVDRAAKVSYEVQHQYIDNHGYKTSEFDAKIAAFDIASGFLLPLPIKQGKDRFAALGAQLDLGASDTLKSGREARFIIDEDNEDLSRVQAQDIDEKETQLGSVAGHLWIEFPLPESTWLALGGDLAFDYPEFERGGRYGSRKGYTQVATTQPPIDFKTEVSYSELLNAKTEATTSIIGGKAVVESTTLGSLTLRGTLEHKLYDYLQKDPPLDGPDTETHFEAWAKQQFLYGFSFSLAVDLAQQQNYIHNGIPTFGTVAADGQTTSGKAVLGADPLPWLGLRISQSVAQTRWLIDNELAQEPFEIAVADYIENFSANVSLNLAF